MSATRRPVIVIKIGTSTLMRDAARSCKTVSSEASRHLQQGEGELAVSTIALLVDTLLSLRRANFDVILVSSGAVGVGCRHIGHRRRPTVTPDSTAAERAKVLATIQGYAAIGQSVLMRTYDNFFSMAHQPVAQVLLTSGDLGEYYQYQNARNTLFALLDMGVIPIVNENDTVATEELKYGDNDWLSALVSTAVGAKWLFLLTDVDQLYTANPRVVESARPIDVVTNIENLNINLSTNATGTQWGTGGMKTKITAARLATAAGVRVGLIHGSHPSRVLDFVNERDSRKGTVFEPLDVPLNRDEKVWISNCLPPRGEIVLGGQAAQSLRAGGPLRVVDVTGCSGTFEANDAVKILGPGGVELARGISNYSFRDLNLFQGMSSVQLQTRMAFPMREIVVFEENLALLVQNGEDGAMNGKDGAMNGENGAMNGAGESATNPIVVQGTDTGAFTASESDGE
eukprot:GFKZ01009909.1.p1 GENE.GFKZ01009909.1~~GFKZ01009909.1.p1  ORF type:complete len:457 (+),score=60.52 GFKZ01009909.1:125-1495(+)